MTPTSRSWSIAAFLLLLSLLLRLQWLSLGPYHTDGLELAIKASETARTGELQFVFGPGYPLAVLLGAVFLLLTSAWGNTDPVFAVNLMSAVTSSLAVSALYLLGQRLFNPLTGMISALLLCVFPIFLGLSVFGTSQSPAVLWMILGIYFLAGFSETGRRRDLIKAGVALGLMGATRAQDWVLVLGPVSILLLLGTAPQGPAKDLRARARHWPFFFILMAGITALFHSAIIAQAGDNGYLAQFRRFAEAGLHHNFRGLFSPSLKISLWMILFALTPLGLILSLGGALMIFRERRPLFWFLLLWFAVPLSFYGNLGTTAPRFLLLSSIPLILCAGCAVSSLLRHKNKWMALAAGGTFVLMAVVPLWQMLPILQFRHTHALMPEFGRFVNATTEPGARIITGDEILFVRHYGQRDILRRPKRPLGYSEDELRTFSENLAQVMGSGTPVYITSNGLFSYDPGGIFSRRILENYRLTEVGERPVEDWRRGETILTLGKIRLFRLEGPSTPQAD